MLTQDELNDEVYEIEKDPFAFKGVETSNDSEVYKYSVNKLGTIVKLTAIEHTPLNLFRLAEPVFFHNLDRSIKNETVTRDGIVDWAAIAGYLMQKNQTIEYINRLANKESKSNTWPGTLKGEE